MNNAEYTMRTIPTKCLAIFGCSIFVLSFSIADFQF